MNERGSIMRDASRHVPQFRACMPRPASPVPANRTGGRAPVLRKNSYRLILLDFWVSEIHAPGMKSFILVAIVQSLNLPAFVWFHRGAALQILALRHQLIVYQRTVKRPSLKNRDRLFWSLLSRIWNDWASVLIFVKPETVIRWRNRKFREFWRKKSQGKSGRPPHGRRAVYAHAW